MKVRSAHTRVNNRALGRAGLPRRARRVVPRIRAPAEAPHHGAGLGVPLFPLLLAVVEEGALGSKPRSATAWTQPWGSQAGSLGLSFPLRTRAGKVPSTPEPAGRPARSAPRCRTAPGVSVHSTGRQGRCQRCLLRYLCNNNNKMLLLAPHTWEGRCLMWALMCESKPLCCGLGSWLEHPGRAHPGGSGPQLSVLQHLKALPEP